MSTQTVILVNAFCTGARPTQRESVTSIRTAARLTSLGGSPPGTALCLQAAASLPRASQQHQSLELEFLSFIKYTIKQEEN